MRTLKLNEYARLGESIYTETLPNGLRLAVVPKKGFRRKSAFLAVNAGGVDTRFLLGGEELTVPKGTAHFVEHRMFDMGSVDAMSVLSERGADANAFTAAGITAYHFDCTDDFYENLELLLSCVVTPSFTEAAVERERGIIAQEILMAEDDPDDRLYSDLLRCLFASHPIRDDVLGTIDSVSSISVSHLSDFHRAFYVPGNMTLAVAGNVEPQRVLDAAVSATRYTRGRRAEPMRRFNEGAEPYNTRSERKMEVAAPLFLCGAKTKTGLTGPEGAKYELTALLALSTLLGRSSALYGRLYDAGLINDTFGYDFENTAGVSLISFGGESRDPDAVALAILEEASHIASGGVDRDFFQRRVKTSLGRFIRGLDYSDKLCYNAAMAELMGYSPFDEPELLSSVTAEDARRFIASSIKPETLAMSVVKAT